MIAADPELSIAVRDRLHGAAAYDRLPHDATDLCRALLATVVDAGFPGALIPSVRDTGEVNVYVAAPTAAQWRRLAPVLVAFAGPTITSFDGRPVNLPAEDPIADLVREAGPVTATVLRLPSEAKRTVAALRALECLRGTLARAPTLQRRAPEPTSWMLAEFQDYLNVGAREPAMILLKRLRSELRLDALNLKFLNVQLLAAFDEWPTILNLPGFASLCQARKPPAIVALLFEALYRGHLAAAFDSGDANATRAAYEEHVRPLAHPMLGMPAPVTLMQGGWRILALEAWVAPSRRDLTDALSTRDDQIGWLATKVVDAPSNFEAVDRIREVQPNPIDEARDALTEFDTASSLDSVASAIANLEKLDATDFGRLREAEPFRTLLRALQQELPAGRVPRDWLEWLEQAGDPAFSNALDIARQGMDEWPVGEALDDPVVVQRFVAALDRAQQSRACGGAHDACASVHNGLAPTRPAFPKERGGPSLLAFADFACPQFGARTRDL